MLNDFYRSLAGLYYSQVAVYQITTLLVTLVIFKIARQAKMFVGN